jgi:hypothetical protein
MTWELPGMTVVAMERDIEIVRIGPDPFGRNEETVFYRDYRVRSGREVFYLWKSLWAQHHPDIPLVPEDVIDDAGDQKRQPRLASETSREPNRRQYYAEIHEWHKTWEMPKKFVQLV